MIDAALVCVIIALLGYMAWDRYETRKERNKLINAIIAKSSADFKDLEAIEKIEVKAHVPLETPPDFSPVETLSDEEFDKHIQEELNA